MSRKLLLSSISIAATATLLGVGAYAKYTDTETSNTTSIAAGTLDLQVSYLDDNLEPAPIPTYSLTNAKPGDSQPGNFGSQGSGFLLHNAGSLPGVLHVYLVKDADDENGIIEPESDSPDLDAVGGEIDSFLQVMVDGNSFGYGGTTPWVNLDSAARVEISSMIWGYPVTIPAGGDYPAGSALHFGWAISPDATNAIMTDSLSFHVEFVLEQA